MRKPKTPLLNFLQKAFSNALLCETKGQGFVDDLEEKREMSLYTRREFLGSSLGAIAAASGVLLAAQNTAAFSPSLNAPRIAIIGGGIAGLNAAYQLKKRGLQATIYEGSKSLGGRITTKNMSAGLTAEIGGEFIDTGHEDMRALAREFHLPLLITSAPGLIKDSYFFGGRHYSEKEVVRAFRPFANKIKAAADAVPDDLSAVKPEKNLDKISIAAYLQKLGVSGWFYDLLDAAFTSEFGLEIGEQSALNFITLIGTDVSTGKFEAFGESDELYKIKGGNNKLIEALSKELGEQINLERRLNAIRQKDGKFEINFERGEDVSADFVVLALPFSTLRQVDYKGLSLSARKINAIENLGYGTNSKLLMSVNSRIWREQKPKRAGYLFNEKVQNGWDNSFGQNMDKGAGGYAVFLGGERGRSLQQAEAAGYVAELDRAFAGFKDSFTSSETVNWSENPFTKGSYACYKVGQWTEISGAEFEPEKNLYFAGEHCSSDFQGYMNGGAETGKRVAQLISKRLKPPRRIRR